MNEQLYRGGCLCGQVRLEARGKPYRVGLCHCMDCRKTSGSLFAGFAIFPAEAVTVSGETAEFHGRHFCPRCGSPVFGRSLDEIELRIGAFDSPDQVTPTYELWTKRREGWLPRFELARHYEGDRPGDGRTEP
jgi:hypothetical protein